MKNIFSKDINEENASILDLFTIREVDEELAIKAEETIDDLQEHDNKSSLPVVLRIINYLSIIGAFIMTASIASVFSNMIEEGKIVITNSIKIALVITIILWLITIVLYIIKRMKIKKIENSEELKEDISTADQIYYDCLNDLKIPLDSPKVDVFLSFYKMKKGKQAPAFFFADYFVSEVRLFTEDDHLCMGDCRSVLAIPLKAFQKIEKVNKKITFINWNKEELSNQGKYKQYKMTKTNYGANLLKSYYRLEFEYEEAQYEFYVPPYDIEEFQKFIELPISEEN